jgi:hypothetical protein
VPEPDRPEEPVVVNGVAWSVRDIGAGLPLDHARPPGAVAVDVPQAYENGAEIVNPLSGPSRPPSRPSPSAGPVPRRSAACTSRSTSSG